MGFTLIRGSFHVVGYSPDGDSIRFAADDAELFQRLSGVRPVKLNARGHAQLRIEAIDSLETHYSAGGGSYHQPLKMALEAAASLLAFAGIRNVQWDTGNRTIIAADDGTRGYLLTRSVEKNGRPVAFVFAGDPQEPDGADIFLKSDRMRDSFNFQAASSGNAYVTFYTGLFGDLRDAFIAAVKDARENKRGVYAKDATNTSIDGTSLRAITEDVAILPKLFRRLTDYIVSTGSAIGFKAALEASEERVLDLRTSNFTHFDTFVEQDEGSPTLKLTRLPEELVFDELVSRPSNAFAMMTGLEDDEELLIG